MSRRIRPPCPSRWNRHFPPPQSPARADSSSSLKDYAALAQAVNLKHWERTRMDAFRAWRRLTTALQHDRLRLLSKHLCRLLMALEMSRQEQEELLAVASYHGNRRRIEAAWRIWRTRLRSAARAHVEPSQHRGGAETAARQLAQAVLHAAARYHMQLGMAMALQKLKVYRRPRPSVSVVLPASLHHKQAGARRALRAWRQWCRQKVRQ